MIGLHLAAWGDPERDVIRKIRDEDKCLGCGIERAVGIGWLNGETKNPDGAIPLCPVCSYDLEHDELDVWPNLRPPEIRFAIEAYGTVEAAREKFYPSDYSRTMMKSRWAA